MSVPKLAPVPVAETSIVTASEVEIEAVCAKVFPDKQNKLIKPEKTKQNTTKILKDLALNIFFNLR